METTNTETTYQGAISEIAVSLDLAMASDDMARWDYFFTYGEMFTFVTTEAQRSAHLAAKASKVDTSNRTGIVG